MDEALRTELARRLGMKTNEITAADETGDGLLVTTHDGQTTLVRLDWPGDGEQTPVAFAEGGTVSGMVSVALPDIPPGGEESAPEVPEPEVPDGTAKTVLEWVDGDPGRAAAALAAEQGRPSPRKSLITELERVVSG